MKNNDTRRASALSIAFGAAWVTVLIAPPAFAQQPIERVEITGSSVKRIDAETALPVQVVSRQEIEATGAANVEQFLQGLGVALQGNSNSVAATASGATSGGVSSVSLRGLGSQRTLVLIDGKRVSAGGTLTDSTTVDVNHIPVAAIERIEVLKDGASAIYGSDAIGGVINFILRKDYKGGEVTPYANITQHPHGSGWGATDRIAAVDRGGAVLQHFDALDRGKRNHVKVDAVDALNLAREALHALAVNENQRGLSAEAPQRRGLRAERRRADHVAERYVSSAIVRRYVAQQVIGGRCARAFDVLACQSLYGQRAFALDPFDVGAGDVNLDVGRLRRSRDQRHGTADAQHVS